MYFMLVMEHFGTNKVKLTFNVHGSVHRNNIPIYISNKMQRYTVDLYLETALHVSGGTSTHHQERIQLSAASGICQNVTATCRYRGGVGTGVPTPPR